MAGQTINPQTEHVLRERRRVRVGSEIRHKATCRRGRVLSHCEVTPTTGCHALIEWRDGTALPVPTMLLHEIAAGELLDSAQARV